MYQWIWFSYTKFTWKTFQSLSFDSGFRNLLQVYMLINVFWYTRFWSNHFEKPVTTHPLLPASGKKVSIYGNKTLWIETNCFDKCLNLLAIYITTFCFWRGSSGSHSCSIFAFFCDGSVFGLAEFFYENTRYWGLVAGSWLLFRWFVWVFPFLCWDIVSCELYQILLSKLNIHVHRLYNCQCKCPQKNKG